jgi:hypothetical protein
MMGGSATGATPDPDEIRKKKYSVFSRSNSPLVGSGGKPISYMTEGKALRDANFKADGNPYKKLSEVPDDVLDVVVKGWIGYTPDWRIDCRVTDSRLLEAAHRYGLKTDEEHVQDDREFTKKVFS